MLRSDRGVVVDFIIQNATSKFQVIQNGEQRTSSRRRRNFGEMLGKGKGKYFRLVRHFVFAFRPKGPFREGA